MAANEPIPPVVEPVEQESWGIIRYAAGSGSFPDRDAAGFDGWYADRELALAVARDWADRYPHWIVALVRSDQIWFGPGDFSRWRRRPLTEREFRFCAAVANSAQSAKR